MQRIRVSNKQRTITPVSLTIVIVCIDPTEQAQKGGIDLARMCVGALPLIVF